MSTKDSPRTSLRVINGSILSNFSHLELSTADEKTYSLNMTPFNRLAMRIIGIPHLGFRMRARIILSEAKSTNKKERILDAGCGYGLYALSLAELGYHVDAIDLDTERVNVLSEMIAEYAPLKDMLVPHAGSLTSLPFPTGSYETIICSEVIEHIKDDRQAVRELARVLKINGRIILSTPYDSTYNQKTFKRFGHERPGYTRSSFEKIMKECGLRIEKEFYYEYALGNILFNIFNYLHSKPLMGIAFYPMYVLYLLDYHLKFGEPNQIIVTARKL